MNPSKGVSVPANADTVDLGRGDACLRPSHDSQQQVPRGVSSDQATVAEEGDDSAEQWSTGPNPGCVESPCRRTQDGSRAKRRSAGTFTAKNTATSLSAASHSRHPSFAAARPSLTVCRT